MMKRACSTATFAAVVLAAASAYVPAEATAAVSRRTVNASPSVIFSAHLQRLSSIPRISQAERQNASATRLYVAAFQSYVISVVDPVSGHALHEIPVTGGQAGIAVAPDGNRLYVVDGGSDGQLFIFDTATWQTIHQEPVADHAKLISGNPLALSGDGRWLLVQHYSYSTKRSWTSVFDTRELKFRPELSSVLQFPEDLNRRRIEGRPGHGRLYADYGSAVVALDADKLTPLWRAPTPTSREPGLVLAPDGERLYGLHPDVAEGCPCPDGRVQLTKMKLRLSVWEAATGRLIEGVELTERLAVPPATIGRGNRGYLSLSPDGARLYIAWENKLWALDASSLRITGELRLSSAVDGMTLSTDGRELYLLPTTAATREPESGLWVVDATSLKLVRRVADWPRLSQPFMFAAPAPREAANTVQGGGGSRERLFR